MGQLYLIVERSLILTTNHAWSAKNRQVIGRASVWGDKPPSVWGDSSISSAISQSKFLKFGAVMPYSMHRTGCRFYGGQGWPDGWPVHTILGANLERIDINHKFRKYETLPISLPF